MDGVQPSFASYNMHSFFSKVTLGVQFGLATYAQPPGRLGDPAGRAWRR